MTSNQTKTIAILLVGFLFFNGCQLKKSGLHLNYRSLTSFPVSSGDTIVYQLEASSQTPLKSLFIMPSIPGKNTQSQYVYVFENQDKNSSLTYSYVVPDEIDVSSISFMFTLTNLHSDYVVSTSVPVSHLSDNEITGAEKASLTDLIFSFDLPSSGKYKMMKDKYATGQALLACREKQLRPIHIEQLSDGNEVSANQIVEPDYSAIQAFPYQKRNVLDKTLDGQLYVVNETENADELQVLAANGIETPEINTTAYMPSSEPNYSETAVNTIKATENVTPTTTEKQIENTQGREQTTPVISLEPKLTTTTSLVENSPVVQTQTTTPDAVGRLETELNRRASKHDGFTKEF